MSRADLNAKYEPAPYPRMLYSTPHHHIVVHTDAEEARARADGYTDFAGIDPDRDGLEHMSREHLIDLAVVMVRAKLLTIPMEELISGIRQAREEAATAADDELPDTEEAQDGPDEFDALSDDDLRAFIANRDGKPPHHACRRPKLLALARSLDSTGSE